MKLIGVQHKKGELQQNFKGTGVFYDYYLLHMCSSSALNDVENRGVMTAVVKIKQSQIKDLNPMNWVGKLIDINYTDTKAIKSIYLDENCIYNNENYL